MMSLVLLTPSHTIHHQVHLSGYVADGFSEVLSVVEEGTGGKGLDPILVPEGFEDLRVET